MFRGIPLNIPWNSMEHLCHLKWRSPNYMESHGTRYFIFGDSRVPWNSMEYPLKVQVKMP